MSSDQSNLQASHIGRQGHPNHHSLAFAMGTTGAGGEARNQTRSPSRLPTLPALRCGPSMALGTMRSLVLDATIVPVPKQRNSREENEIVKRGETPAAWEEKPAKNRQKDKDARWTKKHGKSFFGYKNHVNADKAHKLIRDYEATDAAVHDSRVLETLLDEANTSKDVFGDSAYRSAEAEEKLAARGLRSRICVRGTRGRPLSKAKAAANRAKSRIRARIEHVFGAQETAPGGRIVRTIGIVRARLKIGLQNFVVQHPPTSDARTDGRRLTGGLRACRVRKQALSGRVAAGAADPMKKAELAVPALTAALEIGIDRGALMSIARRDWAIIGQSL